MFQWCAAVTGNSAHNAEAGNANSADRSRIRRVTGPWRTHRSAARIESPMLSRSPSGAQAGRCQARNATMIAAKDTALSANTAAGPAAKTTTPARAGPIARATLTVTLPSDAAAGIGPRETCSGGIPGHAGAVSAEPQPIATVNTSSQVGVRTPVNASVASIAAASTA